MWKQTRTVILAILLLGLSAHADHPQEGTATLEALVAEALAGNPGLKAKAEAAKAASRHASSQWSLFLPELSLEGGSMRNRLDHEKHSGSTRYGKLEWNVFRGGSDWGARGLARVEEERAKVELDTERAKVARETAALFYKLTYVLESVALQERALAMNQEQAKLAAAKKSAGLTSETDVIEFDLREATIQSDIEALQTERRSLSRALSELLGRETISDNILVHGHLTTAPKAPPLAEIRQALLDGNPELRLARLDQAASSHEKTQAWATFLPKADVEGKWGKLANEERPWSRSNNYMFTLTVNLPIFSGFSSWNDVSAASSRQAAADSLAFRASLRSTSELESRVDRLNLLQRRLALEERTLARSEQYYRITLAEYRRGVKNSPDMVGAAERLISSRLRNLEFRRDAHLAWLEIQELVGGGGGR